MEFSYPDLLDLIGTIAFALSGSAVAIRKDMDLFGVNFLAVTTACGGGLLRDLMIGNTPPMMFRNPFYVLIAAICANLFFLSAYQQRKMPEKMGHYYDMLLFWFDTVGLAAFSIDGVVVGLNAGFGEKAFLLVFLGFMTGTGGGALRDIMANQTPDIFVKHVYALASIAGTVLCVMTLGFYKDRSLGMICGFVLIIILRFMAEHFKWNLPRVMPEKTDTEKE